MNLWGNSSICSYVSVSFSIKILCLLKTQLKKWKWHILLAPIVIYLSKCKKIRFELMHHDSRNLIHFSFLRMQFSPLSLKIKIPKYNIERKRIYFLMLMTGKNYVLLSSVQYWNRSLLASGLFFLFLQSNKFYKFHWHMLRKRLFIK